MKKICLVLTGAIIVSTILAGCSSKTTNTAVGTTPKNSVIKSSTNSDKIDGTVNTNIEDKSRNDEKDRNVFESSKLGFSLVFPSSWSGKYKIVENDNGLKFEKGIVVYYRIDSPTVQDGNLFSILLFGTENEWSEQARKQGNSNYPYTKVGSVSGNVYVMVQPPYNPYDDVKYKGKKYSEEFLSMSNDISKVINTFKVISAKN